MQGSGETTTPDCRSDSRAVENTLRQPDVHNKWEHDYRTPENARFYDRAFEYIAKVLNAPPQAKLLDAGCGICDYAIRLASRGFDVVAVDFSESVLAAAKANLERHGFTNQIVLGRENLLELTFDDESFDYILCWGVLMHIPDLEGAISELTRVLKPAGMLVISETNMNSVESRLLRLLRRLAGRRTASTVKTPAGLEHWVSSEAGKLMTRESNLPWLVRNFAKRGLTVKKRVAGQFTELYVRVSPRLLQRAIHAWNHFWFCYVRAPGPAHGNILILEKQSR